MKFGCYSEQHEYTARPRAGTKRFRSCARASLQARETSPESTPYRAISTQGHMAMRHMRAAVAIKGSIRAEVPLCSSNRDALAGLGSA